MLYQQPQTLVTPRHSPMENPNTSVESPQYLGVALHPHSDVYLKIAHTLNSNGDPDEPGVSCKSPQLIVPASFLFDT